MSQGRRLRSPAASRFYERRMVKAAAEAATVCDLAALARRALELAGERQVSIITAESCTAGKLAALLSEAPGAATCLHGSFVTYTKANKTRALGVSKELLESKGAV